MPEPTGKRVLGPHGGNARGWTDADNKDPRTRNDRTIALLELSGAMVICADEACQHSLTKGGRTHETPPLLEKM